jgi:hypothetical protein
MTFSKAALTLLFTVFTATGCVSVNLPGGTNKPASGVKYEEPASPFEKDPRKDVDQSWRNPKNGNVISYLSDCSDASDPSLDSIVQGVLGGLSDLNTESTETQTIQNREARRVLAGGKVDGVPTKIDLAVFKRNHCIYILTNVGVEKSFAQDRAAFNAFIKGFRAP